MNIAKLYGEKGITAQELASIPKTEAMAILDVRTEEEWNEGHIEGAIHIDYFSPNFVQSLQPLDKTVHYYVYCHSGKRSLGAISYMEMNGIIHCTNITDGICGWKNAQLPLIFPQGE